MKTATCITSVVALLIFGCSSNPHVMSPIVAAVLQDSILDASRDVRAQTYWNATYGRGLEVEVWVTRRADEYERNLVLELEGVARVFAALASDDLSVEFDFVEVRFVSDYGQLPPRSRTVVGFAEVIITRETMMRLREDQVQPSEYPQHWVFIRGEKDQPDFKEPLQW